MSTLPQLTNLRSTSAILKAAAFSFSSNTISLLFLSFLLFSFRSVVENGSYFVASYIDRDPSLKSLLSRLDLSGAPDLRFRQDLRQQRLRRQRPFLHLSRVGTLDDDFFSEATAAERSSLFNHPDNPSNDTVIILPNFSLDAGFSPNVVDDGIRFQEIVRPGVRLKAYDSLLPSDTNDADEGENGDKEEAQGDHEFDKVVNFQFFIRGLEMGHHDAAAFFFLVSFLSVAYGWVILGFLVTYSWVLGVVFVGTVNDLLGRFSSFFGVLWEGSRLGLRRLSGFILMRWAVRDALTQLLGLWYFGEIEDQYSFFKLFVRLKLMPFSVILPWVRGFEREISGFLFTWFLIDTLVSFIFAVDAWIAIVDSRKSGREIVKEGCYLLLTMLNQAVQLKCLEAVICGTFVRWTLARVFGKVFASLIQSAMEVFFMLAWLFFYLGARCRDADSQGRTFELRELEGAILGLR